MTIIYTHAALQKNETTLVLTILHIKCMRAIVATNNTVLFTVVQENDL